MLFIYQAVLRAAFDVFEPNKNLEAFFELTMIVVMFVVIFNINHNKFFIAHLFYSAPLVIYAYYQYNDIYDNVVFYAVWMQSGAYIAGYLQVYKSKKVFIL